MQDKNDSFNESLISFQSDSQSIIRVLYEKVPEVEEILTNSIKIIEDEMELKNDIRGESKLDLVSSFNSILEIYELTSFKFIYYRKGNWNI